MKKSLHSSPRSTPVPLAFLHAMPAPTRSARDQPISLPRPAALADCGQNPTLTSPNHPRPCPGAMPQAPGQAAEMLTRFPRPYQKALAARARLQLQEWEQLAWPTPPNSSPKNLFHIPNPSRAQGERRSSGVDEFPGKRWQLGGMLSSRTWSMPVPSTHMGIRHLLLEKKNKKNETNPSPSCIANSRKE